MNFSCIKEFFEIKNIECFFMPSNITINIVLLSIGSSICFSHLVEAKDLYFDPHSLDPRGAGRTVDLETFTRGEQLPGIYRTNIYINNTHFTNQEIFFILQNGELHPQLTVQDLEHMGINTVAIPALAALDSNSIITNIEEFIPQASTQFDFSNQRLDVSVPQASLKIDARNSVDPSRWDQGLTAFLMSYNMTGSKYYYNNNDTDNLFLNLSSGLNVGPWRLRNNSTYIYTKNNDANNNHSNSDFNDFESTEDGNKQKKWQNINTYLQRDIHQLGGQLTLGENTTSGMLFDSLLFRGAQLVSDDSMLPDSQRGFAPVIRGIANSSAQITIRQNGYVIYQTYVAPGPYAIKDLYATSGSGDLEVIVREENGSERSFIQPYSSVPLMQREGRLRYEFTAGQYRSTTKNAREPGFGQGSLIYGISNVNTVYGGITGSNDYNSVMLGIGQGLESFGSVSFDVTEANTRLSDNTQHSGQSYRLQYAKDLFITGTTFTLASYRYSTSGYFDFNEANQTKADSSYNWYAGYNKRSRMQVQISQTLGDYGSLFLSAYQQDYWSKTGYERNISAGYNISLQGIAIGLTMDNTKTLGNSNDYQYALSVQIPFSQFISNSWVSFATQVDANHRTSQSVTLNGQAQEEKNLNYMIRESIGNKGQGNGGGGSLTYKSKYGNIQSGYSYTNNSQQYTAGVQGGIIIHPYGLTLSQPLGDTVTLVRAPGATELKIQNQQGVSTDWRGYAVVPYAISYHDNRIALSSESLNDDVDIMETVKTVTPTKGAVVLADFETRVGNKVLVTLRQHGKYIPFGAVATLYINDDDSENELGSGIVGDKGELYISGVPENSFVKIKWSNGVDGRCKAKLLQSNIKMFSGVVIMASSCDAY